MRYKLCRCGGVKQDAIGSVCSKCGAGKKRPKQGTTKSGYDGQWKKLSERVRALRPLCERCEKEGIAEPATEVHHIISIDNAPWLRLEVSNLECLCNRCHRLEHAGKESHSV